MKTYQQHLTITSLGPLKDIEVDIKDFIAIIGPQSSGKSTISKSVYFFKSIRTHLISFLLTAVDDQDKINVNANALSLFNYEINGRFYKLFGPPYNGDSIGYTYSYDAQLTCKCVKDSNKLNLKIEWNSLFKEHFNKIIAVVKDFHLKYPNIALIPANIRLSYQSEKDRITKLIFDEVSTLLNDNRDIIYIPAARGLLSILADQLTNVDPKLLDLTTWEFLERINQIKNSFSDGLRGLTKQKSAFSSQPIDEQRLNLARKIIKNVLKAEYKNSSDGDKLFFSDLRFTKLSFSSSGQQESVWIMQLIFLLILNQQDVFIVIEEPEAHLYPEAQNDIIQLIALLFNTANNQIILTTHSPYILSSLNNLLYASKVGISNQDKVAKIVNQDTWVGPDRFEAYSVNKGQLKSIFDKEAGLVETLEIDSASTVINETYDKIFNLDD